MVLLSATANMACVAIQVLSNTTLGPDPQTVNRLNGESFQQDALVTFDGREFISLGRLYAWLADAPLEQVINMPSSG